ncbi:MAG TPA: hypothetical protein VNN18_02065 [Candidatus Xenobia bacterium]|nr:hypothetical protein [Candidatus Xenobia bacterium]
MALLLRRRGIQKVRPLEGGLQSWRQLGFPMKSSGAAPAALESKAQEA